MAQHQRVIAETFARRRFAARRWWRALWARVVRR
jgi:hypothetical protein